MANPKITVGGLVSATAAATALAKVPWAAAAGSADTITAAYTPANASLFDGMILAVRLTATNTTTTPTFNPDGLGAHTIVKNFGGALEPGDLPDEALLRYKLSTTSWWLLNPNAHFRLPSSVWAVAGGSADALTAAYVPATGALVDGTVYHVRGATANLTTTPTFAPDGQTARTIKKFGGQAVAPGDIMGAGHEFMLRYHASGTWYELMTPGTMGIGAVIALYKEQAADAGGTDVATAQPWFPAAGGVTVIAGQAYRFTGQLWTSRAAGANSHTTAVLWGGTATITRINYVARAMTGDANALVASAQLRVNVATATVVKTASTSTSEQVVIEVEGVIVINAGGTLIPQFQESVAAGGVPTIKAGTFLELRPYTNPTGTWA